MSCGCRVFSIRCCYRNKFFTMKFFLMCLILAAVGLDAHTVELTAAQKEKARQHAVECIKQSGIKPEVIAEVKKGNIVESDELKKFTLCFFQKSGIVGSDGQLNIETALAKLPPGVDKAEATKVFEECKKNKGKTAEDTAFQIFKCYRSGIKTHISLGF